MRVYINRHTFIVWLLYFGSNMFFDFGRDRIAILITYNDISKMEYRIQYLDRFDMYVDQDLLVPIIQAHFVEAFHGSPVYYDYAEALFEASMIATEQGDGIQVDTLNYSQHDFAKFMEYSFAKRLIDSKRNGARF